METYTLNLDQQEHQYREQMQAQARDIEIYKQRGANMMEIVQFLASRLFTVGVDTRSKRHRSRGRLTENQDLE